MNIFHKKVNAYNATSNFLKYNCPHCNKFHIHETNNDLSNRKIKVLPLCCDKKDFLSFFKKIVVSINKKTIKYH